MWNVLGRSKLDAAVEEEDLEVLGGQGRSQGHLSHAKSLGTILGQAEGPV